ncbi:MAG TPA: HAD family phosphatase [Planctomycetaceae bacterium]|nr:HAD family phosphatase [Planctomycetaceae bacterium]HRE99531.1 HAD family phosphatase [Pirellulaceae bacterium]
MPVAAVFDMDGLLLNTEHLYDVVIGGLLAERGQEFDLTSKRAMMGRPAADALGYLKRRFELDESIEGLAERIEEGLFERLPTELMPLPGVIGILDEIERLGIPASVATSSRRRFAERALAEAGLAARFRFLICGDEIARGKPEPDIYLESARRHAIAPEGMLVFEDSIAGATAATRSGAATVAVPGEHNEPHEYPECRIIVRRIDDPRAVALVTEWGRRFAERSA